MPGALNPTVKSLDKFLLFNENVVDPGSLTNSGVLPGFCGGQGLGAQGQERCFPPLCERPQEPRLWGRAQDGASATWWLPVVPVLCLLAWVWRGSLPLPKPMGGPGPLRSLEPQIFCSETPKTPLISLV